MDSTSPKTVKTQISPFAATNFHNEQRAFGIKTDDRRRHMYIVGKTGMGKSTLLENLVYADIHNGNGICYVDPHGDTAEKILQWIPENRVKDVIYFNPADLEHPLAFNVLEKVAPQYRNLVASGLVSVYKKLWADSWGPRLEYILRYCILALLDSPDSTLLGINRMLVDKKYRDHVLLSVQDPVVKSFWNDEFSKWNDRVLAEVISPIQNKVGQFLSNSMIRNIVGQLESTLDMRKIMDEKKILILNLSKGRMGEDASSLLGAMMITKLQLAAMSRVDIPEEDRQDFYLYVDEFQNFATESFANILSEARKYRLNLTIAHQYIAQLTSGSSTVVRDAVFGNVGTIIAFRVGATDAEFLEKEFAPQFTLEDLINLPKFRIYLRLMVDGVSTDPFSADSLGPLASKNFGFAEKSIEFTRQKYATSREKVVEIINEWSAKDFSKTAPPPGATAAGGAPTFHSGTEPIKAYEDEKAKREGAVKEQKSVVWSGNCDVCGRTLDLTFVPDLSRPVLCQDDLKAFRKGGLSSQVVEKLMAKVMERKIAARTTAPKILPSVVNLSTVNQATPKPVSAPIKPRPTTPVTINNKPKPVAPAKGTIRFVGEFSNDESVSKLEARRLKVGDDSKIEDRRSKVGSESNVEVAKQKAILPNKKFTIVELPKKAELKSSIVKVKSVVEDLPANPVVIRQSQTVVPKVADVKTNADLDPTLPKPRKLTPGEKVQF